MGSYLSLVHARWLSEKLIKSLAILFRSKGRRRLMKRLALAERLPFISSGSVAIIRRHVPLNFCFHRTRAGALLLHDPVVATKVFAKTVRILHIDVFSNSGERATQAITRSQHDEIVYVDIEHLGSTLPILVVVAVAPAVDGLRAEVVASV